MLHEWVYNSNQDHTICIPYTYQYCMVTSVQWSMLILFFASQITYGMPDNLVLSLHNKHDITMHALLLGYHVYHSNQLAQKFFCRKRQCHELKSGPKNKTNEKGKFAEYICIWINITYSNLHCVHFIRSVAPCHTFTMNIVRVSHCKHKQNEFHLLPIFMSYWNLE